jgi:hydroxymethylpyrimidine pyrophosphatase-like HAD family hydrolase/fructoselysine-6-P-deglycase FrlB-like protein
LGKTFESDLQKLDATYEWAKSVPIAQLTAAIAEVRDCPMLVIGSGGSLTAAHFVTRLHQDLSGHMSKHLTPMEFMSSGLGRTMNVVLVTARGDNQDIISLCNYLTNIEVRSLTIVCAVKNSPISDIASRFHWVRMIDYALPSGRDGFLATNSLLAFSVLFTRAYVDAFQVRMNLPDTLPQAYELSSYSHGTRDTLLRVLERPTVSVLYEGWAHSAALDVESKFTEAALANVHIADYRNFAHGRHHWLAKHAADTGVIAFLTPNSGKLAEKTLALIPSTVPVARLTVHHAGPIGGIGLLTSVFYITKMAGIFSGIDPGRPGVPEFGRRIYHLGLKDYRPNNRASVSRSSLPNMWIDRKLGAFQYFSVNKPFRTVLRRSLTKFMNKISKVSFAAVVCDYDGTLCSSAERFGVPSEAIIAECLRLVRSGVILGIATGRGKYVRENLRQCFPKHLWRKIIIGYYNGADIASLDENAPDPNKPMDSDIEEFCRDVIRDTILSRVSKIESRPSQVTFSPVPPASIDVVHKAVLELLSSFQGKKLKAVCSDHSVDVLSSSATKKNVVQFIKERLLKPDIAAHVLCIGDKGTWCGNDFDILSEEYALSVNECPFSISSGWNIASAGHKGVQASLDYLMALKVEKNQATLDLVLLGWRPS